MNITDVLGKKNSTRNLTDDEFENVVSQLAEELEFVDYTHNFSDTVLINDWKKLCNFTCTDNYTNSVVRVGSKLCDNFFPNFFHIKNDKGVSFESLWKKEHLIKVLKWNRKSHSTPYLSELRRGVYFCNGLTKNTMYRPHMAKMVCDHYKPNVVLDPCCGWGGRMLGAVASGAKYIGFDPNPETFDNLNRLSEYLSISDRVMLFNTGAENMHSLDFGNVDLVLTSPPYFNLEIYCDGIGQSENQYDNYDSWRDFWLKDVIQKSIEKLNVGGVSCWNVHNVKKMNMIDDVRDIHETLGYSCNNEFGLRSSARQSNQNKTKNKKTQDSTLCYVRG